MKNNQNDLLEDSLSVILYSKIKFWNVKIFENLGDSVNELSILKFKNIKNILQ